MSSSFSNVRPSILVRPKRVASAATLANSSHLEVEHERAEQRLQAKREVRMQREEQWGKKLWGNHEEKAQLASEERAAHEELMNRKRLDDEFHRAEQFKISQTNLQYEEAVRQAERARLDAKREYLARLRDDNYQLSQQRQQIKQEQRKEEIHFVNQFQNDQSAVLNKFGRHAVRKTQYDRKHLHSTFLAHSLSCVFVLLVSINPFVILLLSFHMIHFVHLVTLLHVAA